VPEEWGIGVDGAEVKATSVDARLEEIEMINVSADRILGISVNARWVRVI